METNLPRIEKGDISAVYNGAITKPIPVAIPNNILPNTIILNNFVITIIMEPMKNKKAEIAMVFFRPYCAANCPLINAPKIEKKDNDEIITSSSHFDNVKSLSI